MTTSTAPNDRRLIANPTTDPRPRSKLAARNGRHRDLDSLRLRPRGIRIAKVLAVVVGASTGPALYALFAPDLAIAAPAFATLCGLLAATLIASFCRMPAAAPGRPDRTRLTGIPLPDAANQSRPPSRARTAAWESLGFAEAAHNPVSALIAAMRRPVCDLRNAAYSLPRSEGVSTADHLATIQAAIATFTTLADDLFETTREPTWLREGRPAAAATSSEAHSRSAEIPAAVPADSVRPEDPRYMNTAR